MRRIKTPLIVQAAAARAARLAKKCSCNHPASEHTATPDGWILCGHYNGAQIIQNLCPCFYRAVPA